MCCFISLPICGSLAPQVLYLALYLLSWPQWQAPAVALPQALAGLQLAPGVGILNVFVVGDVPVHSCGRAA